MEWAPVLIWVRKEKLLSPLGIEPRLFGRPVTNPVVTELPGPLMYINKTNVVTRQTSFVIIMEEFIDLSHLACCTVFSADLAVVETAPWTCV